MKKILYLVLVLIFGAFILFGCSNNNSNNVGGSNTSTINDSAEKSVLDSKLVDIYLSSKETQKQNKENNVWGEDDAKFDSEGRLWVKKSEVGDITRETHEMSIDYTYSIYKSEKDYTVYCKHETTNMNTDLIVSTEFNKDEYVDNNFDKIDITSSDFEKIQNEFENMKDRYDELLKTNNSMKTEKNEKQTGKKIINEWTKNNDKIIKIFNDGGNGLNSKLIDIYNSYKKEKEMDAKFNSDGLLLTKKLISKDNTIEETYQIYLTENIYNEYRYVFNGENKYYEKTVDRNKRSNNESEYEYEKTYSDGFGEIKNHFNQLNDEYNYFVDNKCIINNTPKVELVTSETREQTILEEIDKITRTSNFTREQEYIAYQKLNRIFKRIMFSSNEYDSNYLQISNKFKSNYDMNKGILSLFSPTTVNFYQDFKVLNNNVVTFNCINDSYKYRGGLPSDYVFYVIFIYDEDGNIDDIVDIKCMLPVYLGDGKDEDDYYISGASGEGLSYLSGQQNPWHGWTDYKDVYTSDRFWKTYNPNRGILNIDINNISNVDSSSELSQFSTREVFIINYDENNKNAQINVKMKDGAEYNYLIKWKTIDYNLLDEVEVIDLNAVREFKDGKFYLNGIEQKNSWVYYDGYWYYCDNDGNLVTNKWIDGMYLDLEGKKAVSCKTPDGKYVDDMGYVIEDLSYDLVSSAREKDVLSDAWYKTRSGLWYYFENDRTTTKKGWFTDSRDNQTYYLDPKTGIMQVGYVDIDGDTYYFNQSHDNEPNWYEVGDGIYESLGKKVKAYGSMYVDEVTPNGRMVDNNGKIIQ